MVQDDITILIKTFERPDAVKRLVESIRTFYQDIEIIVIDDSERSASLTGVTQVLLPFDVGLSRGRNLGMAHVRTPYVFICDDDCIFTDETDLGKAQALLNECAVDILGVDADINYCGTFETHINEYTTVIYRRGTIGGSADADVKLYDFIPNIFLAKTAVLLQHSWDESLKMGEHFAFFYDYLTKVRVGFTSLVKIKHEHIDNEKYKPFRDRALTYVKQYMEKKNIRKRIDLDGNILSI